MYITDKDRININPFTGTLANLSHSYGIASEGRIESYDHKEREDPRQFLNNDNHETIGCSYGYSTKPIQSDITFDFVRKDKAIVPCSNKPEYACYRGQCEPHFTTERKIGPVEAIFKSQENIEKLGDYFDSLGLGRPSYLNMQEHMDLLLHQERPFEGDWRRDKRSLIVQINRLNSLLIADLLPQLKAAKEEYIKYRYDSYYGYAYTLVDRPNYESWKRKNTSLEFIPPFA